MPKVWTGSAWLTKTPKVWTGSTWAVKPMKVWTGTTWKAADPVTVVGSSYINQVSASTTMTMTLPSGLQTGDRLYIAAFSTDTNAGSAVTESITGWTAVTAKADVGTAQRALYTALYTSGLAAPVWTLAASRKSAYACVAVRYANASPVVDLANGGGLTSTAPTVTGPIGLTLRFYVRKDSLSGSVTAPSGSTLITGALGVATGPSAHILAYSIPQATAGATGTAVTTWPVTSTNSTAWTIAL